MILEEWYHQTDCDQCGEQICFLEDPHTGKRIPTESNGNDHRQTCSARQWQRHQDPPIEATPPKPINKKMATEHEKRYEGQQGLSRWF